MRDNHENVGDEFEAALLALDRLVIPALERIGRDREQGCIALPQVYMSGRVCAELGER